MFIVLLFCYTLIGRRQRRSLVRVVRKNKFWWGAIILVEASCFEFRLRYEYIPGLWLFM